MVRRRWWRQRSTYNSIKYKTKGNVLIMRDTKFLMFWNGHCRQTHCYTEKEFIECLLLSGCNSALEARNVYLKLRLNACPIVNNYPFFSCNDSWFCSGWPVFSNDWDSNWISVVNSGVKLYEFDYHRYCYYSAESKTFFSTTLIASGTHCWICKVHR